MENNNDEKGYLSNMLKLYWKKEEAELEEARRKITEKYQKIIQPYLDRLNNLQVSK